jgi:hypothetical protein
MEIRVVRRLFLIAVLLMFPAVSYAQDATLSGTVRDTSGGVLPDVTVTALHETTGNTFVAVTDGVGAFHLPEVITNRFDATQGRSAGMIANAITKSGTNAFSGGIRRYFRDAKLNAADKVQHVVLPAVAVVHRERTAVAQRP